MSNFLPQISIQFYFETIQKLLKADRYYILTSFLKNMAGWWGLYQIYMQMDKIYTIFQSYANKPH